MTDIDMTRLAAEAMGTRVEQYGLEARNADSGEPYWPLHDDAQAMALVKRFKLNIGQLSGGAIQVFTAFDAGHIYQSDGTDLNRAIVECVAKLQAARKAAV